MPWLWKTKKTTKRSSWGPFRWTREDRAFLPDRITEITIQIYVAPPRCPRCETLMVNERCPRAPGRRKWCDG